VERRRGEVKVTVRSMKGGEEGVKVKRCGRGWKE